jgi:virginiamycin B lyase
MKAMGPMLVAVTTISSLLSFGQAGTITEYPLRPSSPTNMSIMTYSAAGNICPGPDGNIWYVATGTSMIGMVTPAGSVSTFPLPLSGLTLTPGLVGCAFGPDGRLYFSDQNNKKVFAFNPSTQQFTQTSMPAPNTGIAGLTFGADGNAWIMISGNNAVRRMTPSGSFLPVIQLAAGRYPHGPSSCPDGNVWFAEFNGNRVARVTMLGQVTEILLPRANSQPFSTACGGDGVYFTEQAGRIGRVNYTTLALSEWPTPIAKSKPTGIAIAASGNVYFAETGIAKIGMMPPAGGLITEYKLPVPGAFPDKLAAGAAGRIWFSQHDLAGIGAIQ